MALLFDNKVFQFGACPFLEQPEREVMSVMLTNSGNGISLRKDEAGIPLAHSVQCPSFQNVELDSNAKKVIHRACCIVPQRMNPITNEREIFLTRRNDCLRAFPNVWVFPGGHADDGETLTEAAIRELREETGMTTKSETLSCIALWESCYPPTKKEGALKKQHLIFFYTILLTDEEIQTTSLCPVEVGAGAWLSTRHVQYIVDRNHQIIPKFEGTAHQKGEKHASALPLWLSGLIIQDGIQKTHDFDVEDSFCGSDLSVGKERLSSATAFVLTLWLQNHFQDTISRNKL